MNSMLDANGASRAHRGTINCLVIKDDTIVTSSVDCTLRAWSLSSGQEASDQRNLSALTACYPSLILQRKVYDMEKEYAISLGCVGQYVFAGCSSGQANQHKCRPKSSFAVVA